MFNADTQPAQVAVSLDYYDGSEKHKHKLAEMTIPPRATEQIDVGAILAAGAADADGDTIPANITFGGYRVQKVGPHIDKVLITEALVFDRQTKSYLTFYNTCCALFNVTFGPSSVVGVPGDTGQLDITALEGCGGNTIDVTSSGTFSTFNSAVATVGSNSGLASLVNIGQTTLDSEITYFTKDDFIGGCNTTSSGSTTPATVTPKILFGGSTGTDITNNSSHPQSVVVGQQIVLYASYTLPSGVTVSSQSWSIPGAWTDSTKPQSTVVGGFNVPSDFKSGGPTTVIVNQQSTTFYWVTAGNSQTVTFTLNLSNGTSPTATATFNVSGPTSPGAATQLSQVLINSEPALSFGNFPSTAGIQFTASATPPTGYSNSFEWVQIITNDTKVITLNNDTTTTCVPATTPAGGLPFLDNEYPYDTNNPTTDIPETVLDSTQFKELKRNFSATMYLLWKPGLQNSIFVPLGTVSWQWSGDAVYNAGNQTWTLNSSSKSANAFSATSTYPMWSRYSNFSSQSCH